MKMNLKEEKIKNILLENFDEIIETRDGLVLEWKENKIPYAVEIIIEELESLYMVKLEYNNNFGYESTNYYKLNMEFSIKNLNELRDPIIIEKIKKIFQV